MAPLLHSRRSSTRVGPFVVLEIALDGTVAVTAVLAVAAIKVVRS
jgi:hypothetical protein